MNTLTIDIGNSRVKVDSWADNGLIGRELEKENVSVDEILKEAERLDVKGMIVSTVRDDSEILVTGLKERFSHLVLEFDTEEIEKHYNLSNYRGKIGPDRVAAFLGAESLIPGVSKLVVDLGTAMTIDLVDENGTFCGGNISIGYSTRKKALAKATSRLPEVKDNFQTGLFGNDTSSAIEAGTSNGVEGEIYYTALQAKQGFNTQLIIATGGDLPNIVVKAPEGMQSLNDAYLVGRGLDYHLRKVMGFSSRLSNEEK